MEVDSSGTAAASSSSSSSGDTFWVTLRLRKEAALRPNFLKKWEIERLTNISKSHVHGELVLGLAAVCGHLHGDLLASPSAAAVLGIGDSLATASDLHDMLAAVPDLLLPLLPAVVAVDAVGDVGGVVAAAAGVGGVLRVVLGERQFRETLQQTTV